MPLALPEGYWSLAGQPKGGWNANKNFVWQSRILIFAITLAIFALLTAFVRFMFSATLTNLKFRQVIDSSPVPYILVGRDRKISFINPAFTGLYGYSMRDLPTLAIWWNKTNIPKNFLKSINDWWNANLGVKTLLESSVEIRITCLDAVSG